MAESREIQDVICLVVPDAYDGYDVPEEMLERLAIRTVAEQYTTRSVTILLNSIEWLITGDPDEAEKFQPVHDCVACRAGADQSRAFLKEHPGKRIALGNLVYTEIWP